MSTEQILNEYKSFLDKSKTDKLSNDTVVNSILREYNKFISNSKSKSNQNVRTK